MWENHPDIARKWTQEGKGNVDQQFGAKPGNGNPVGNAANANASSKFAARGRGKPMDKARSEAIERRMKGFQKKKGEK